MKLISLQDVTQSDLPFVCAPFYAWCIVDDAHSGFVRIKGYDELFENCKRQACQLAGEPSHWNDLMLGREQMDNHVKRGSLALVMESGDFPLHPMHRVFVEKNGQPQVRENSLDPSIRQRLQYHVDRLHHERLERERYAANHSLTGEPEYLPVAGPGHRPMTLGPHEGNLASNNLSATKSTQVDSKQEIADLMQSTDSGNRQKAIDKAIELYDIDMTGIQSVKYDPNLDDNGVTSKSGNVRIGKAAFTTASPGWLGSTLGHEIEVHIQQQALKGNWWTDEQGTLMQEVQAYDYEIANAKRYGLSEQEINELKFARRDYYRDLSTENKVLADKGDFSRYKP